MSPEHGWLSQDFSGPLKSTNEGSSLLLLAPLSVAFKNALKSNHQKARKLLAPELVNSLVKGVGRIRK